MVARSCLWAFKHMQTLVDNDNVEFEEMIIAGDKTGLLFRKVMFDWVQAEQRTRKQLRKNHE